MDQKAVWYSPNYCLGEVCNYKLNEKFQNKRYTKLQNNGQPLSINYISNITQLTVFYPGLFYVFCYYYYFFLENNNFLQIKMVFMSACNQVFPLQVAPEIVKQETANI